jgi:glycosyltransferase involved in cell wall biosynthesis
MKNILHITETSEAGGSEAILAYTASNLDPKQYRSVVCLLEDGWLHGELERLGVKSVIIENKRSYDPVFLANLIGLVRREKIDLIHAYEFVTTFYGAVTAKLTRIPAIGAIHGKGYFTEKTRRRIAYKIAVGLSSQIVAVSNDLKNYLESELHLKNHDKIMVIPNGIDINKHTPGKMNPELKRQLGIPDDALVCGTVGALAEVKGFPYLIEAAGKVANVFPNFRLLLVGEGRQEAVLKEKILSMGLQKIVIMTGFRSDIPDLLNLFDLYVCSSLSEGLSLSIMEALAAGKPVVATNVGGNPELIIQRENGLLVPPKDPEALADNIIALLRDKVLRDSMSRNGRKLVESKYSLEKMVESYQDLYRKFLS